MLNVIITALKAPWPTGATFGDCVALHAAELPAWAIGKCIPAPDEIEPVATWAPPAAPVKPEPAHSVDDQLQAALALKEAAEQSAAEALGLLKAKDDQLQAALAEIAALKAPKKKG